MGITNELMEYARDWEWLDADNAEEVEDQLVDIAHHIDKEHKKALDAANEALDVAVRRNEALQRDYNNQTKKIRNQRAQLAQVQGALERRNNGELKKRWRKQVEAMQARLECEYVRLPVDANGVPIRVGDMVVDPEGHAFDVGFIYLNGSGIWTVGNDCFQWSASKCRHYHKPTVEDVLNELLDVYCSDDSRTPCQLVAEYAAKLQLKEVDG